MQLRFDKVKSMYVMGDNRHVIHPQEGLVTRKNNIPYLVMMLKVNSPSLNL